MIKKIIKLIIVIFFMGLIFFFSSDSGDASSEKSDGIIIQTVQFILGRDLTQKEKDIYVEKYVVWVRKGAHFTIYFLLGLSFISFLKEYQVITYRSVFYTLLFVFLYACSDEVHQLFQEGRSFQVVDILIDSIGGFISSNLFYFIRRKML